MSRPTIVLSGESAPQPIPLCDHDTVGHAKTGITETNRSNGVGALNRLDFYDQSCKMHLVDD